MPVEYIAAVCRMTPSPIQTCQWEKVPVMSNWPAMPMSDASRQNPSE